MDTGTWHDITSDYGVLELDETATAPALELHLVRSDRAGVAGVVAWWCTEKGETLAFVDVGEA